MLVSFIIPHKGREEMLHQTLASICQLDTNLSQVEVLICSQNSSAIDTQAYAALGNIKTLLCPEQHTISYLRNYGVKNSTGNYIAFIDADVALSNNWLTAMIETLKNNDKRVLCSAYQQCDNNAPILEKIRTALSNLVIDARVNFLPGRNLFMTRTLFDQTAGFPEHLVTCEDYYFTDQVNQLGELYYTSKANYIHLGEDKQHTALFKKEIWRAESNLLSLKGRNIPLSEYPSILVPLWIAFFLFTASLGLIFGDMALLLFGLAAAALPVLLYSYRLYRQTKPSLTFIDILHFYAVYFPARAIGTCKGLWALVSSTWKK